MARTSGRKVHHSVATSLFDAWFERFTEQQPAMRTYLEEFRKDGATSNPHLLKFETEGSTIKEDNASTETANAASDVKQEIGETLSNVKRETGLTLTDEDDVVEEKSRKGRTWRAPSNIQDSDFSYELPKSLSSRARAQKRRKLSSSGSGAGGSVDTPGSRWEREIGVQDAEDAVVEQCEQLQDAGGLITQQLVRQLMAVSAVRAAARRGGLITQQLVLQLMAVSLTKERGGSLSSLLSAELDQCRFMLIKY